MRVTSLMRIALLCLDIWWLCGSCIVNMFTVVCDEIILHSIVLYIMLHGFIANTYLGLNKGFMKHSEGVTWYKVERRLGGHDMENQDVAWRSVRHFCSFMSKKNSIQVYVTRSEHTEDDQTRQAVIMKCVFISCGINMLGTVYGLHILHSPFVHLDFDFWSCGHKREKGRRF